MQTLENDFLKIVSSAQGAELKSVFSKHTNLEYMWQAGREWQKHAPVLFPIVGQLKGDTFYYNNKPFNLPRHGFARDSDFVISNQSQNHIQYLLQQNTATENFPFSFNFFVSYTLFDSKVETKFEIENTGNKEMYFSVGGHPAFRVPLYDSENYDDYYLEFDKQENASRYLLQDGLLSGQKEYVLCNTNVLWLSKSLFYKDALVFKDLQSERISIKSKASSNGLHFNFNGFDSFGIWAAKDADFVCLEPWMGHTDWLNHNQNIVDKEGIIRLSSECKFCCNYFIEPF
ncbi:MAG TPA: aldose 1-epimerase family protein [Bacteroidia bacterium]|nr:aldose 1-epimerase family protein [Bacteroidia bacterium]HNU33492.1 aldose 1-epimerase family protein [Bacteroidia bacterium]